MLGGAIAPLSGDGMGKKDPHLALPEVGGESGVWRKFFLEIPKRPRHSGAAAGGNPEIHNYLSIKSWIPGSPLRGAPE